MDSSKVAASGPRIYDDFEPSSVWKSEEDTETLVVQLPEFKKENIRVLIDNHSNLRISGERRIPGAGNRWNRFRKDFLLPENCDTSKIRARFEDKKLHVTVPKQKLKRTAEPPVADDMEPKLKAGEGLKYGAGASAISIKKPRLLFISVAMALIALVGIGVFVTYNLRKSGEGKRLGFIVRKK